jgi:hypothetical protein
MLALEGFARFRNREVRQRGLQGRERFAISAIPRYAVYTRDSRVLDLQLCQRKEDETKKMRAMDNIAIANISPHGTIG